MNPRVAFIYSPKYCVDIGAHVFQTSKYRLIADRLAEEMKFGPDDFIEPDFAPYEALLRAHDQEFLDDMDNLRWTERTRPSELPITKDIIDAAVLCAGGSIRASREALDRNGIGFHIGGGWHHSFPDHAEGFCYINDIAVAIINLKAENAIQRAIVVDCDLHQGNGTAYFFRNDPDVWTFSIHQENLYPMKQRSDLDIGLENFAGDDVYLKRLGSALPRLNEEYYPCIVFYVAGADPYEKDQLGSLQITKEGLRKRDELVIRSAAERGIPVVVMLAGGYAPDVNDTVEIHCNTAQVALEAAGLYE